MTVSRDVLDRLRTSGWEQRTSGHREGPNCLSGALYYVLSDGRDVDLAPQQLAAYKAVTNRWGTIIKTLFPERATEGYWVFTFNDSRHTTFADVEQVLTAAAAEEEQLDAPPLHR